MHVHYTIDGAEILQKLNHLLKHQHEIMAALDDLKAKLASSDAKIDIIVPAIAGVTADVAFIKAKLEEVGEGSINPAGVAELLAIVTAQDEKLATAATDLAALDAATDPNA